MAHDYYVARDLSARIALLDDDAKAELDRCLEDLMANPEPDGITRIAQPPYFPYRPGAIAHRCGRFSFGYTLANQGTVLEIYSIYPLPDLPAAQ
jgi:hypothetical protein